jgi:hypothetical protein
MCPAFVVDISGVARAAQDLSAGGVYVPEASVALDQECRILLRAGDAEVMVRARAVLVTEEGAGFQIEEITTELRERIAALVELAKDGGLGRRKTLTRALADGEAMRRSPAGSIPPTTHPARARRIAQGSLSPLVALAPTQRDETLAQKARLAQQSDDCDDDDEG